MQNTYPSTNPAQWHLTLSAHPQSNHNWWTMHYPDKGLIKWQTFPCHDVIIPLQLDSRPSPLCLFIVTIICGKIIIKISSFDLAATAVMLSNFPSNSIPFTTLWVHMNIFSWHPSHFHLRPDRYHYGVPLQEIAVASDDNMVNFLHNPHYRHLSTARYMVYSVGSKSGGISKTFISSYI